MCVCVLAVKVVLLPDGHVMTLTAPTGLCIRHLKHHLSTELKVPAEELLMSLHGTRNLHLCPLHLPRRRAELTHSCSLRYTGG